MFNKVTGLKAGLIAPTDKDVAALKNRSILLNLHAMYVGVGWTLTGLLRKAQEYNKERPNNITLDTMMVNPENVDTNTKARSYNMGKFAASIAMAADKKEIKDGKDLLNYSIKYFQKLEDAIKTATENYRFVKFQGSEQSILDDLDNTVFDIEGVHFKGFSYESKIPEKQKTILQFKHVEPHEILGNDMAKKYMFRDDERLLLFDFKTRINPMVKEFKALTRNALLIGYPGTGKTLMMQAEMTYLDMLCQALKIPHRYFIIDAEEKDPYYGETQKKFRAKLNETNNPDYLGIVFADDIDLFVVSRLGGNTNSADNDVLKLLMDYFAGVNEDYIGNMLVRAASNDAATLDPALLQRFPQRHMIEGPVTAEQAAALLFMKFSKAIKQGIVDIPLGKGFDPKKVESAYKQVTNRDLSPETLQILHDMKISKPANVTWLDMGHIAHAYQKINPRFTGRFLDNVAQNVMASLADFDLDKKIFTEPKLYFDLPYEQKVKYLRGQFKESKDGTVIVNELDRYFQSEIEIFKAQQVQMAENMFRNYVASDVAKAKLVQAAKNPNSEYNITIRQLQADEQSK